MTNKFNTVKSSLLHESSSKDYDILIEHIPMQTTHRFKFS